MNVSDVVTTLNGKFAGTKTYGAAVVAILTALSSYFSGSTTLLQALYIILPSIYAITIRHGITTETQKAAAAAVVVASQELTTAPTA